MPISADNIVLDSKKAASLRRIRSVATACVIGALGLRVGAKFLPNSVFVDYLRAFSEAAVVGGLADWFAVTALFRHPLKMPIPHTRILPRNKDRIAKSLSNFVVTNFLNREVVERELAGIDLSLKRCRLSANEGGTSSPLVSPNICRAYSALWMTKTSAVSSKTSSLAGFVRSRSHPWPDD